MIFRRFDDVAVAIRFGTPVYFTGFAGDQDVYPVVLNGRGLITLIHDDTGRELDISWFPPFKPIGYNPCGTNKSCPEQFTTDRISGREAYETKHWRKLLDQVNDYDSTSIDYID